MPPLVDCFGPAICLLGVVALIVLAVVVQRISPREQPGDANRSAAEPPKTTLHGDMVATARMLRRLCDSGALDDATRVRIMQLLRAERDRQLGYAPPPVPQTKGSETARGDAASPDKARSDTATPEKPTPEKPAPVEAEVVDAEVAQVDDSADGIQYVPPSPGDRTPSPLAPYDWPAEHPPSSAAFETAVPQRVAAAGESVGPAATRRPMSELLRGFMEQRNIRWGELVAGLLIVGCSTGLVISLRESLSGIPYFPALLFMLVTGAIHGAGMYTLRRWKLATTSRSVLVIGMLLIPLSFLAGIVLTGQGEAQRPATDWKFLTAVAVGLVSFGAMAYFSSRALSPRSWLPLAVGVVLPSTAQLLINRLAAPQMALGPITILAALPMAGFLLPIAAQLYRAAHWKRLSPRRAGEMYLLVGLAAFSLAAALALLFWKAWDAEHPGRVFEQLSPLMSLACAAVLAVGLAIARLATSRGMAAARVIGVALALLGGVAMAAWVAAAWPSPAMLTAVGATSGAVLVALARAGRLPALYAPATACLALASLLGFHWLLDSFGDGGVDSRHLVIVLLMGRSALLLTSLAAVVGAVAWSVDRAGQRNEGQRDDARWLLWSAAGLGGVSVLITLYSGYSVYSEFLRIGPIYDRDLAAPLLAVYALAALVVGYRLRLPYVTWCGALLLWLGLAQALAFNQTAIGLLGGLAPRRGVLTASLLHAVICTALVVVFDQRLQRAIARGRRRTRLFRGVVAPLACWALISSIGAAPFLVLLVRPLYATHAVYALALAGVWLALSLNFRWPVLYWAFQAVGVMSIWYALLAVGEAGSWWNGEAIDLGYLPVQVTVLAGWSLAWSVGRRVTESNALLRELSPKNVLACDQLVLGLLVLTVLLTAAYGCWPGTVVELGVAESLQAVPQLANVSATHGLAAWTALLAVAAALAAAFWERVTLPALIGLLAASAAIPLLAAGTFESVGAVASAVRWGFALWGVALVGLVCFREPLRSLMRRQPWARGAEQLYGASPLMRGLSLAISGAPLIAITLVAAARRLEQLPVGQPVEGSLLAWLGPMLSYPIPLVMYVGMLVAYAIRERRAAYMLGGSIVLQGTVNLLYALRVSVALGGLVSGSQYAVELLQWNALSVSAFALLWLALHGRLDEFGDAAADADRAQNVRWWKRRPLLAVQVAAALTLVLVLGLFASVAVTANLKTTSEAIDYLGRWPSYAAWGLTLTAAVWVCGRDLGRQAIHLFSAAALVIAALAAATVASRAAQPWWGMHVLEASWLVTAVGCVATASWFGASRRDPQDAGAHGAGKLLHLSGLIWASTLCALLVGVAILSALGDPTPWWPGAAVAVVALLAGVAALRPPREAYRFASLLAACLAVVLLQLRFSIPLDPPFVVFAPPLLTALLTALCWLGIDLWRRDRDAAAPPVRVYHVAAAVATGLMLLLVLGGALLSWLARGSLGDVSEPLGCATLMLLGVLLTAMLWQRNSVTAPPLLLVWGVLCLTMALDQHEETPLLPLLRADAPLLQRFTVMAWALALAAYAALVGQVWRRRRTLAQLGDYLGVPTPLARLQRMQVWLTLAVSLLSAVAIFVEVNVVLTFPREERWLRVAASFAPALAALAFAALTDRGRPSPLRQLTMVALTFAAALISWSDMPPIADNQREPLHLAVRLLVVLAGLSLAYVGLARWLRAGHDWYAAVWKTAAGCGVGALIVLAGVLIGELAFFGATPPLLTGAEITMVAVVLVALAAALLMLALMPAADPLSLSESARQAYVYAAQAVVALLLVHLYLGRPDWFSGPLRAYWPFVAMAIAFSGVGLGELFHRLRIRVLAEPFSRTGLMLPLLPALGMWVVGAEQTSRPLLLLVVGLLYALTAMTRRSLGSGIAAAVAGNAALWALMSERRFDLVENPQFWLIPPALCVLAAAQLERRRLSEQQLTAIRYAAMLVIYISSTSEILFVRAVAELWPPMLLTALSVIGVMTGIALRIRAFLYLGTSFVLVSVVTMVHHAALGIDQTWPWWAFGVCVGLALLASFIALEVKRKEILAMLERLKHWEN
ncbi:MAG: hypothetical protein RIC55_30780 [Pirellulaceae bacterium]